MCQQGLGVYIALAAMGLVTVKTESVVKAPGFAGSFSHELFTKALEVRKVFFRHLEVRDDGATCILSGHMFS
jgi:hypothetical protein